MLHKNGKKYNLFENSAGFYMGKPSRLCYGIEKGASVHWNPRVLEKRKKQKGIDMTQQQMLKALASEIEYSTGCTDPGSVCLAAAAAAHALGGRAEEIRILVSPNVYKNGVSVGIPGTGRVGLELAAALGVLLDRPERGLAILSEVTDEMVRRAEETVAAGRVTVEYGQTPDPLYVRAEVRAGGEEARAVIMYDYSNVVEITRNHQVLLRKSGTGGGAPACPFLGCTVEELYHLILSMDPGDFGFLLEGAVRNKQAALRDLEDPGRRLGRTIRACTAVQGSVPLAVSGAVRAYTAATGMAAAVAYLLGGGYEQSVHAMQTVVGTIGGMFCDGAKSSCAYKLSTAAALAVQAAYLAMEGCHVPAGEGIIGTSIEETFANIGRLNDPGMLETDRVMVSIIAQRRARPEVREKGGAASCWY